MEAKMKLLDAVVANYLGERAPKARFCDRAVTGERIARPQDMERIFLWKIKTELSCTLPGRIDERDRLIVNAVSLIAREVYGEVVDDLYELLGMLHREGYRGVEDPICIKIKDMIDDMQGRKYKGGAR